VVLGAGAAAIFWVIEGEIAARSANSSEGGVGEALGSRGKDPGVGEGGGRRKLGLGRSHMSIGRCCVAVTIAAHFNYGNRREWKGSVKRFKRKEQNRRNRKRGKKVSFL